MKKFFALLTLFIYAASFAYTPNKADEKYISLVEKHITRVKNRFPEKFEKLRLSFVKIDLSVLPDNQANWKIKKQVEIIEKLYAQVSKNVTVIDGDTVIIKNTVDGVITEKNIRMIGIDAPESYKIRYGYVECFGPESKNHLIELLQSRETIIYETDDTQGELDKYGRTLGYILADGININQKMIEDGFAFEYTYKDPYAYQSVFQNVHKKADNSKNGFWNEAACNGDRKKGTPDEVIEKNVVEEGDIESSGDKKENSNNIVTITTPTAEKSSSLKTYHTGPRGGCYYLTDDTQKKEYVDKSFCHKD